MTAQSIACGACAAEVPYGRLSCPSCGELLASVAGSRRGAASVATSIAARPAAPDVLNELASAPATPIADGQLSLEASADEVAAPSAWVGSTTTQAAGGAVEAAVDAGEVSANGLLDDDADPLPAWTPPASSVPWGTASELNGGRTPAYMARPGRRPAAAETAAVPPADSLPVDDDPEWLSNGSGAVLAPDEASWPPADPSRPPADPIAPVPHAPEAAVLGEPVLPPPARTDREPVGEPDIDLLFPPVPSQPVEPQPSPQAEPEVAWPAPAAVSWPEPAAVSWPEPAAASWPAREEVAWPEPGAAAAFVAAAVASPDDTLPAGPAVAAASVPAPQPIEAFAGPGAYLPPAPVAVPAGPSAPAREWAGHPGSADGVVEATVTPDATPMVNADLRVRLLDFVKWLSVAGAAFAAVGFLLPWGQVVIGSDDTGYFGRWGIAGPWHLLVALAILGSLGLALIDNRVPVWIRTGIAGLGLGALLLGLVWPYLTLPSLGAGPGSVIAAIGAVGLVASGILALVADRHAEPSRPV